jgi:hypothetical protein
MTAPKITTPKGSISINANNQAQLVFNANFVPVWQSRYTEAQKFVDTSVQRGCEPYIPLLTGMLIMSGILGTDVGSGLVQWIAPYAKAQYYGKRAPGSMTGALRGPAWFRRWREVSGDKLIAQAKRIAGSGV